MRAPKFVLCYHVMIRFLAPVSLSMVVCTRKNLGSWTIAKRLAHTKPRFLGRRAQEMIRLRLGGCVGLAIPIVFAGVSEYKK